MRCSALRLDGEQCRAHAVLGGERCAKHRGGKSGTPRGDDRRGGGRVAASDGRASDGPAYYANALGAEEFDAYLQALGLESLRDEAALIRAKVRAHLGSEGDDRRELPMLLRAIDVLVRVVQADRAAQRHASARSQDLAKVVEEVLAGLDGGEPASGCAAPRGGDQT